MMFVASLLQQRELKAQILSTGDVLGPGAPPSMIGIEVGFGKHQQQGTYGASCGCLFQDGTGSGFLGSLVFELPINYEWVLGIKGGIDFKNTTSTTILNETAIVNNTATQSDTIASMPISRIGNAKTTYVTLSPFIQYQFFRMGPFLQMGPTFGLLVANHFTQTRQLLSDQAIVGGQTFSNLRFVNGTLEETVDDGPIDNISNLRVGLLLSAGYNVVVSERSVFTPMLTYDYPLTSLRSTAATGWKIGSLYASAVLKFLLN